MFKSIRLKNFKAYRDTGEVPLAPLTVIVGLNNSGKSTLLHGILVLKQTAQDANQRPALITNGLVDLNGFYDIVHGQQKAEEASFSISLVRDQAQQVLLHGREGTQPRQMPIADRLDVSFGLGAEAKDIEVEQATLAAGDQIIIQAKKGAPNWRSDFVPAAISRDSEIDFRNFIPDLGLSGRAIVLTPELIDASSMISIQGHFWMQWLTSSVHWVSPIRRRVPWSANIGARASTEFGLAVR